MGSVGFRNHIFTEGGNRMHAVRKKKSTTDSEHMKVFLTIGGTTIKKDGTEENCNPLIFEQVQTEEPT